MPGSVMLKGRVMLKGGNATVNMIVKVYRTSMINMFTVVFPPFSITLKVYLPFNITPPGIPHIANVY